MHMHGVNENQANLQKQVSEGENEELAKKYKHAGTVLVDSIEGMYLISKIMYTHAEEYLKESKLQMEDPQEHPECLASKLAVMQKGETFRALYETFNVIRRLDKLLAKNEEAIQNFAQEAQLDTLEEVKQDEEERDEEATKITKSLKQCKLLLRLISDHVRIVALANLQALQFDGRITLQELIDTVKISDLRYGNLMKARNFYLGLCGLDLQWTCTFSDDEDEAYVEALDEIKFLEELGFDE